MSSTIDISASFALSGGNVCERVPTAVSVAQASELLYDAVLSCTTSDTALTFGSITGTSLGWLMIQNEDATNYVTVGPTSGGAIVPCVRVEAGRWALMYLEPSITLRVQANTATCKVRFTMFAK